MHIDLEYEAIIQSNLMSNVLPVYCQRTVPLHTLRPNSTSTRLKGTNMYRGNEVPSKTRQVPSRVVSA